MRNLHKRSYIRYQQWDKTLCSYSDPGMMAKPLNFRFLYRLRKHVMLIDLLDHVTPRQANVKQLFEQRLVKTRFRKNPYKSSYGINANKFYRYHF